MNKRAFTIVEVLVTLVVVGIAAVATIQVVGDNVKNRVSVNSSNGRTTVVNNDATVVNNDATIKAYASGGRWKVLCSNNSTTAELKSAKACSASSDIKFDAYKLYYVVFDLKNLESNKTRNHKSYLGMPATFVFDAMGTGGAISFADAYNDPWILSPLNNTTLKTSAGTTFKSRISSGLSIDAFNTDYYRIRVGGDVNSITDYSNLGALILQRDENSDDARKKAIDTVFVYDLLDDLKTDDTADTVSNDYVQICGDATASCSSYTGGFDFEHIYQTKVEFTINGENTTMLMNPSLISNNDGRFLISNYKGQYNLSINSRNMNLSIAPVIQTDSTPTTSGTVKAIWAKKLDVTTNKTGN